MPQRHAETIHKDNTHTNLVDESIEDILSFKLCKFYYLKAFIYNILTLGLVCLFSNLSQKVFLSLYCNPCEIQESEILLISTTEKLTFLVNVCLEDFNDRYKFLKKNSINEVEKKRITNSYYMGEEKHNKSKDFENIIFYFKNNKYIYLENSNQFRTVEMNLNLKNSEIHRFYSKGISNIEEYNYLLNKFGENIMKMKSKSYLNIILKKIFTPINLYTIFVIILWTNQGYLNFAFVVFIFSFLMLLITSYQKYSNYKKICNYSEISESLKIEKEKINLEEYLDIWKNQENKIDNIKKKFNKKFESKFHFIRNLQQKADFVPQIFLVPGDIIYLEQDNKVPCDCLILEGSCAVTESYLTGESNNILKHALPDNNLKFSFEDTKSILFQGSQILDCEFKHKTNLNEKIYIKCLVINTGFNTFWGSFLQNILFPKQINFKFYKELKFFIYFMFFLYLISLGFYSYIIYKQLLLHEKKNDKEFNFWDKDYIETILLRALDIITIIIPPNLYICIRWTSYFFNELLWRNNITCLSEKRLNAAGKVNTIVLDKTGTLTDDGIDIFGFQTTKKINENSYENSNENFIFNFDNIHKNLKTYDSLHMEFWSRFSSSEKKSYDENFHNYQNDAKNNPVFFIECLACCLSIDKLQDNKILGNNIDKKIFEFLDWNLEKIDEKYEEFDINYQLHPQTNFMITEDLVFKKSNSDKKSNQYLLKIIKRFEFSSNYQSNSVIVKNELDGSFRFFIKGAPEKIKSICIKESLPDDFDKVLENHSKKGLRVLACATKILDEEEILFNLNDMENEKNFRQNFECQLKFLGFVILANKLKPVTTSIIKVLNDSNSKIIMATGDNPYTSISVANECKMISNESKICLIDVIKIFKDDKINNILDYSWQEEYQQKFLNSEIDIVNNDSHENLASESMRNNKTNLIKENTFKHLAKEKLLETENYNPKIIPSQIDEENINRFDIKKFFNEIDNQKDNFILCVSGEAFKLILNKIKKQEKEGISIGTNVLWLNFTKLLSKNAKIFYRMNPDDKVSLINFIKTDKASIVAMCGDGANDCGALLSSDIGISLNDNDSTKRITSHFSYKYDSIACIDVIIRIGRANYENNLMILKFSLLYAELQAILVLLLQTYNWDLIDDQYFYLDFFVSLFPCLLAAFTNASFKFVPDNDDGIYTYNFMYKLLIQAIIQPIMLIGVFFFYRNFSGLQQLDEVNITKFIDQTQTEKQIEQDQELLIQTIPFLLNSYCFIFNAFQNIIVLFAFNLNTKHRQYIYSNKSYIIYLCVIILFTFDFICNKFTFLEYLFQIKIVQLDDISKLFEQSNNSLNKDNHKFNINNSNLKNEYNRLFLILFIIACFLITLIAEYILEFCFRKEKDEKKNKIRINE